MINNVRVLDGTHDHGLPVRQVLDRELRADFFGNGRTSRPAKRSQRLLARPYVSANTQKQGEGGGGHDF